jgi:hypothetical protein
MEDACGTFTLIIDACMHAGYLRIKQWRQRSKDSMAGLASEVQQKLAQVLSLSAQNYMLKVRCTRLPHAQ